MRPMRKAVRSHVPPVASTAPWAVYVMAGLLSAACVPAQASDVKLRWTNPSFNAAGSCDSVGTDSLTDLYRTIIYMVRVPQNDTLQVQQVAKAELPDSAVITLADSVHYVSFFIRQEDFNGNRSCESNHLLLAIPARDWEPGLAATYFDNEDLTAPFVKRTDQQINFAWGTGSALPGMGPDLFSERWEGEIYFPTAGVWQLHGLVEDGWRAWVNGVFVANDFGVQPVHESTCQFNAWAGWTPIVIEAMHHNGNAQMTLSWTPPGGVKEIVPIGRWRH